MATRVARSSKMAVGEEDSVVVRMINSAVALRSETLDLGSKGIFEIPKEILNLKHLESLHLEANYITELPEEFFEKLTSLKWLDLRNNRLSALPKSVGKHRSLRSLLLEGNSITHLPCELGMTKSLCGLSLSSNPLEFPPPYIVKKGTQEVLKYLREMCENSGLPEERYVESGPSNQESEEMDFLSVLDVQMTSQHGYKNRLRKPLTMSEFPEPVNTPATFHQPPKRIDQLRYEYDKLRISSSNARETLSEPRRRRNSLEEVPIKARQNSHSRKTTNHKAPLDSYTPSSASSLKEAKVVREKRLRRTASLNQKETVQQQRIKNKLALDDWRQESRSLQQQKQYEALRKGVTKVKVPSPFATEGSQASDDRKGTQKKVNEYNKRLQSLLDMNDKELSKKVLKDRELEKRIKVHMKKIREHRDLNFEHVSDEVEEAKNNLEMAYKLHEELGQRRAMEYRLRAFTGDDFVPNPRYYKNNNK